MTNANGERLTVSFALEGDGSADALFNALLGKVQDTQGSVEQLGADITKALSNLGKGVDGFSNMVAPANAAKDAATRLDEKLENIGGLLGGIQNEFGAAFDPAIINQAAQGLEDIAHLQQQIEANAGNLTPFDLKQIQTGVNAVQESAKTTRLAFSQTASAHREAEINKTQTTNQASRERIAATNAERSANVVATQKASALELANIRSSTALQVEASKSASRRRVAALQLAGRAIVAVERSIRAAFRGTAKAIGLTFRGLGRTASSAASGVRKAFTRSNKDIQNSYSNTWNNNTQTVQNNLNKQSSSIKNFAAEASSSLGGISPGGLAIGGILGLGAAKALKGGFERAATLEDSERALTILLGDAKAAADLRDEILDVVTGTPFKLDQFADGATQLAAFGVEAEKIPGFLTAIGDAASVRGGNAGQTIDTLIRVFGQVTTASRISLEDINSISEAGVPALKILGNAFGETAADIRDMISEGAIPAEEALDVLTKGIEEGTDGVNGATVAFAGMGKELGSTLRGRVANFGTAFDRLGANLITSFTPLISIVLETATNAVDLFGSAISSLGDAVKGSPIFAVLVKGFNALNKAVLTSKDVLKPAFDFIAEGIVALGSAFLALQAIKNIPGLFSLIGVAVRRIFTPMHLLVGAGILVAGFFKRLIDSSPSLRIALENLGSTLQRAVVPLVEALATAFTAVVNVLSDLFEPAIEGVSNLIVEKAVPALIEFNLFIRRTVIPAIREIATWVTDELAPAIAEVLARAVEIAKGAFKTFVSFIRDEVIPVVGPILTKAVDTTTRAFTAFHELLSRTVVPFIQDNLIPVLGGLAGALGIFALTGNLPLAGLVAGIGLAVAAFQDDELSAAISETVKKGVDKAKEFLSNIVDSGVIAKAGVGILKLANKLGKVLGDILSDRRLLAGVAGIAAAAVAIAGAFVAGFIEGLINNIPELIGGLVTVLKLALSEAFGAILSDPLAATFVISLLAGGAAIAAAALAGRRIGQTYTRALTANVMGGAVPGQSTTKGFVNALFGGRGAIAKAAQAEMVKTQKVVRLEGQRLNRIITEVTGAGARDSTKKGSPFISPSDVRGTKKAFDDVVTQYGRATVGAAALRAGVGQLRDSIRFFGRTTVPGFRDGLRSIGQGLKLAGPQIATAAGAIAGGAFMASFVATAIFDMNSSGVDKLQAGLGLAATGVGTAAVLGFGTAGIAAGAAVVGVGLLTSKLKANAEKAKIAAARVQDYADALRDAAGQDIPEIFSELGGGALESAPLAVVEALDLIGFSWDKFSAAVTNGTVVQEFGDITGFAKLFSDSLAPLSDREGLGGLAGDLDAAGVSADTVKDIMVLLAGEIEALGGSITRIEAEKGIFGDPNAGRRAKEIVAEYREELARLAEEEKIATAVTQAYEDKLEELNEARLDALRDEIDDTKEALEEAKTAAEEALAALVELFTTNLQISGGVSEAVGEVIVEAESFAERFGREMEEAGDITSEKFGSVYNAGMKEVAADAQAIIQAGIDDGTIVKPADVATALQPIIDEFETTGGAGGDALAAAYQNVLDTLGTEDGAQAFADLIDASGAVELVQKDLDAQENNLEVQMGIEAETILALRVQAIDAGIDAGEALGDGVVLGIGNKKEAVRIAADALGAAAENSLLRKWKVESPSKVAIEIGGFFSQGLAIGITSGATAVETAVRGAATKAVSTASSAFKTVGAAIGKAISQGLADEGFGILGSGGTLVVETRNAALTNPQIIAATVAEAAAAIFAGGSPTQAGLGTTALDVERARLDTSSIFRDLKDANASLAQDIFKAAQAQGKGESLTSVQKALLANIDFQSLGTGSLAGQINRSAFLDAGASIQELGATLLASGDSFKSVRSEVEKLRDGLIAQGKGLGFSTAEMNELLKVLGLTDAQLTAFGVEIAAMEKAAAKTSTSTEDLAKAQEAAAEAAREAAEAEKAKKEAAEQAAADALAAERAFVPPPVFNDLIVNVPTGDPEAIALATANKVAFGVRR